MPGRASTGSAAAAGLSAGSSNCGPTRTAAGPPGSSPLFGRDNVIAKPHTSFYSDESLVELQTKAADEVVRVLTGEAPRNPVNPEALQRA